ncbi:hypothetical protein [Neobacillus cucumis]|nr:hypothetical protein [Neobacillus cucumis]
MLYVQVEFLLELVEMDYKIVSLVTHLVRIIYKLIELDINYF